MVEMQTTHTNVRFVALNLLAMREHSHKELETKLVRKFGDLRLICDVLSLLVKDGLQSDERFAEAFVRMRIRQGKGPVLIGLELAQKGIGSDLIQRFTSADAFDWNSLAITVHKKKFGLDSDSSPKNRAKQVRFMASRGFGRSQIQVALDSLKFNGHL